MIEGFPEACRLPDDIFEQLPLHVAANFRASSGVLKRILESFPEAAGIKDVDDRLPLHYACHDGYPNNVSLLIKANRSALFARDADGKTPADLCRESESPHRDTLLMYLTQVSNMNGFLTVEPTKTDPNVAPRAPEPPDYELKMAFRNESPSSSVTPDVDHHHDKTHNANNTSSNSKRRGRSSGSVGSQYGSQRQRGSSLETPRSRKMERQKTKQRSSSLERLESRRETYAKFMKSNSKNSIATSYSDPFGTLPQDSKRSLSSSRSAYSEPFDALAQEALDSIYSPKKNTIHSATKTTSPPLSSSSSSSDENDVASNGNTNVQSILFGYEKVEAAKFDRRGNAANKYAAKIDEAKARTFDHSNDFSVDACYDAQESINPKQRQAVSVDVRTNEFMAEKEEEKASPKDETKARRLNQNDAQEPIKPKKEVVDVTKNESKASPKKDEAKARRLNLRKEFLVEECSKVEESINKKQEAVDASKDNVSRLESKIRELQRALENERKTLDAAASGVTLYKEILAEHQEKIQAVNRELQDME